MASEYRCRDTRAERVYLLANYRRTCTNCGKERWSGQGQDSLFRDDPNGKVCDLCLRKPVNTERHRQAHIERGHKAREAHLEALEASYEAGEMDFEEYEWRRHASAKVAAGELREFFEAPEADLEVDFDDYDEEDDEDDLWV